jgi:RNA polymerase sigma-70 factor (ECF subfamily)
MNRDAPRTGADEPARSIVPPREDDADVARAAAGDRRAFERLYRRHGARVHSLACRLIGSAEGPEVTQDVFVRAWQKLGTFRGEAAFSTWLHRLAVNVMMSHRAMLAKKRERFLPDDAVLGLVPDRPRGHGAGVDLERAIAGLPPGARAVFVLHDVEGFTHEEIAERMDVTAGTSKAQLHRARLLLRRTLDA